MKDVAGQISKKIIDAFPTIPVSIGQELNWDQLEEYIKIIWESADLDDGVRPIEQFMSADIEIYSKKPNLYRVMELATSIKGLLKHSIHLSGSDWVDVREVRVNYLDLETGRKAVVSTRIAYWR